MTRKADVPTTKPLSDRQQRILDYVREFWRDKGYSPSYREIGAYAGGGAPSVVAYNLRALQRRGLLRLRRSPVRRKYLARGIMLPAASATAVAERGASE